MLQRTLVEVGGSQVRLKESSKISPSLYWSEVNLNYRNKIKGRKLNFALQLFSSTVVALLSQLAALRDPRGVMEAPELWHI